MSNFEVKALFATSRRIHPKFSSLSFGKYTIEPIPSTDTGNTSATDQYLLRFPDESDASEKRSNPDKEAKLILSMVSLCLGTRLEVKSLMLDSMNVGMFTQNAAASGITGVIESLPDLQLLLQKFNSMDLDIARQFLRAADVYRTAVNLIGQNNTLSYFLLTVAIECMSNKIETEKGNCESFVDFILTYLQDKSQIKSEEDWKVLLKEIYYRHRSGFTHGGKEIPDAALIADRLNRVYVKTPSLKWFESVVRNVLLGFLITYNNCEMVIEDRLKEISLEYGVITLKAISDINAGSVVFEQDFDLD